jgi:hypothetical protein
MCSVINSVFAGREVQQQLTTCEYAQADYLDVIEDSSLFDLITDRFGYLRIHQLGLYVYTVHCNLTSHMYRLYADLQCNYASHPSLRGLHIGVRESPKVEGNTQVRIARNRVV